MSTSSGKIEELAPDECISDSIESNKETNKGSVSLDGDSRADSNDGSRGDDSKDTDNDNVFLSSATQLVPPSPSPSHCDEGPTVGFLHPEMFTGEETIVVSAEPDSSPAILDSSYLNDQRKFSFSANHNNITFHRRFPQVDSLERLINYYSCALQAEILLQGYLYITENYFAFYSNILGLYKTKLLIPVCDVRGITREKTAIIIPNAVGIDTHEGKYVFGSLLSRETTYRLMMEVWKNTISKSLLQMETFPFDSLRPSDGISDNGNSCPSTPTKDALLADGKSKPDPLRLTAPSQSSSSGVLSKESIKATSLSRSINKSTSYSKTITQADETPSSVTDSDTNPRDVDDDNGDEADDDANVKPTFKLKPPNLAKVKSKRAAKLTEKLSRLSLLVKSFKERLKGLRIPIIHVLIVLLLVYLLVSTMSMIHRISNLQEIFAAITSDPKAQQLFNTLEMVRIKTDIEHNFEKIEDLKSNLLDLLASIEKMSNNCLTMEVEPVYQRQTSNSCPLD